MPLPTSTVSRKRTRSRNLSESNNDHEQETSTSTIVSSLPTNTTSLNAPPKRQRNNPSSSRTNYSLRNRSLTPDSQQLSSTDTSTNSQRYNLRPRPPQTQFHLPQISTRVPRRIRRQIPPVITTTNIQQESEQQPSSSSSIVQPRQYRFVYISDDDDHHQPTITQPSTTIVNTTLNLVTDDEDNTLTRSQIHPRRTSRSISSTGLNTRSRTATNDNQDFSNGRHNRAIEIVIDSIHSLEGAVNNFDQLVFGLIYGRLSTQTEFESLEGMIRLSRILNLSFPSRLTQDEIDALPKIKFLSKSDLSSILLVEKCPICLTEFIDEEIINKLHCTHLFHSQCISTWLNENDSCPTCRRKVNED